MAQPRPVPSQVSPLLSARKLDLEKSINRESAGGHFSHSFVGPTAMNNPMPPAGNIYRSGRRQTYALPLTVLSYPPHQNVSILGGRDGVTYQPVVVYLWTERQEGRDGGALLTAVSRDSWQGKGIILFFIVVVASSVMMVHLFLMYLCKAGTLSTNKVGIFVKGGGVF